MTSGVEGFFGKSFEDIAEQAGVFLFKTLYMIYMNLTVYNVIVVAIKYLPMIIYVKSLVGKIYRESQKRMKLRNTEIEDILQRLDIVNAKIPCQEAELKAKEEELKKCTEQLRLIRAEMRQIIAKNDNLKQKMKLPVEALDFRFNKPSEEESKLFEELIMDCNVQNEETVDEIVPLEENTSNAFKNDENRDYTIKIVKVTNVYKMSYLQHYLKQKRLQQTRHAILNKKKNNTQKLLNDVNDALNAVTRREYMDVTGTVANEAMSVHKSYEILHGDEDERDETYQDYDFQNQNQCLTYGNYSKALAPERETMTMDYMNVALDRRYETSPGYKQLFVLPEETCSEIEIDSLDVN